jgi:hypothetical protein
LVASTPQELRDLQAERQFLVAAESMTRQLENVIEPESIHVEQDPLAFAVNDCGGDSVAARQQLGPRRTPRPWTQLPLSRTGGVIAS